MRNPISDVDYIRRYAQDDTIQHQDDDNAVHTHGEEEIDRIAEAQTDEQVEHYNSRREIRKSVGKASVVLIWATSIMAIVIMCIYVGCLAVEPFVDHLHEVRENFEKLFYKMIDIAPWVLLFLFGDIKKLSDSVLHRDA